MSDSQAALKALEGQSFKSLLREIDGNVVADELVRKQATRSFTGPEPFCGLQRSAEGEIAGS